MNFTPVPKDEWIKEIRRHRAFDKYSDKHLSWAYDKMLREIKENEKAIKELGGVPDVDLPDFDFINDKSKVMKNNILNLPDDIVGKIIKELYAEYEMNLRNMFDDSIPRLSITPKQIVEVLHRQGLEKYATQVYILFGGMYAGCAGNVGNVIQEVNAWVSAYRMADELHIDVSEVDPIKALAYYECKD